MHKLPTPNCQRSSMEVKDRDIVQEMNNEINKHKQLRKEGKKKERMKVIYIFDFKGKRYAQATMPSQAPKPILSRERLSEDGGKSQYRSPQGKGKSERRRGL